MSNTLFRGLDLIGPDDLVLYHGSIADRHGLYLALPCDCRRCFLDDVAGSTDVRYRLSDPYADDPHARVLRCARRQSITRSAANV
ncbi:hypothetical protein [Streptomyces sp. NPDC053720]|uniref:hypothetical protein n=1 Tax=Streptomyces sp. NPDC053720 TaxID=3154855 RepID=UPI00341FA284